MKYLAAAVVLIFLLVRSVPFMKGQESIWVFFLGFVATTPFNLKTSKNIMDYLFFDSNIFLKVIYLAILFLCMLAVEEIILGIISRVLWKKQKESFCRAKKKQ